MLVLTRKSGESIRIGDDVRIVLLDIKGHQIRLGIEAPDDVPIHREELYIKIQKQNVKAAEVGLGAFAKIAKMMFKKDAPEYNSGIQERRSGSEIRDDSGE